jgi:tetratricopeptide (TPR) repeat protein
VAKQVGFHRQYISRAENPAHGLPSENLVTCLDAVLNARGALVALWQAAADERRRRRDRLHPSRSGHRAVSVLPGVGARADTTTRHGPVVASGDEQDHVVSERALELFVRAQSLVSFNDHPHVDAAVALLDQALAVEPGFSRARAARGYAQWRRYFAGWGSSSTELEHALRDVDAALRQDPGSVGAHTTLIWICWDMGWHERGVDVGRRVLDEQPDSLGAALAYARALHNAGLADAALPVTERVLAADPTHPTALKLLIWSSTMIGDYDRAVRTGLRYLPDAPKDANTRWAVAVAHLFAGSEQDAVRTARDAVRADPADLTVRLLEGQILRCVGEDDAARAAWGAALRYATALPALGDNRRHRLWHASIQACLGHDEPARATATEVTADEPHNGYVRYRAAHIVAELGDTTEAVRALGDAVQAGFLSVQLLGHDERLALRHCPQHPDYPEMIGTLLSKVEQVRARYCSTDTLA